MKALIKKNFISGLIDWFITPENIQNFSSNERYRARIIISAEFLVLIFLIQYMFGLNHSFPTIFLYNFSALLASGIFCIMGFRLFKIKLVVLAYICAYTIWTSLVVFLYLEENYFNGTPNWFFPCILITCFIVNIRAAGVMTIMTIAVLIINFIYTSPNGLALPTDWTLDNWSDNVITDHISVIIFGYIIIFCNSLSAKKSKAELLLAQQNVTSQQEMMCKSSQLAELGEVAASIAHEINNPLTVIQAHSQYLKRHIDNNDLQEEKLKEATIKIEETCIKINKIVKSLATYSRKADDDLFETVDLASLMVDIQYLFFEKFKTKKITFKFNPLVNQIEFFARKIQIYQVLVNLINNASDAIENETEKWIEVKTISRNDEIRIMVLDSGPGIDKELEKKVLQAFFTTKPMGKGTGLGLSIANNILLQHNGKIQIKRVDGHSCITLIFPAMNEEKAHPA